MSEPGSAQAAQWLAELVDGTLTLAAPEHLVGEVGNGLRKRIAQGLLSRPSAAEAMQAIADVDLELVAGPERWFRSLGAALDWGVTTYDALHVLLALDLEAEVVTADAWLASAARAHSLPVRLLAG